MTKENVKSDSKKTKRVKKSKNSEVSLTMYTQQLDYMKKHKMPIYNNDPAKIVQNVYDLLSEVMIKNDKTHSEVQAYPIRWIAWNIHDKDFLNVWSDVKQKEILEPKATHIHMVIKFDRRVRFSTKMSEAIGDNLNNFEKPSRGRYAEENMLAYLVHAKTPSKHFYDKNDVGVLKTEQVDDANRPVEVGLPTQPHPEPGTGEVGSYVRYFNEHRDAWMKQRATRKVNEHKIGKDELIEKIFDFDITKDEVMTNDDYRSTYIGNSTAIDKAFEIRLYRKFKQLNRDFDDGKFDVSVIYIWGASGNGKTTLARQLIKRYAGENSAYIASSSNPFDSYRGEDLVIMDDVKANTLSPNEWLSLMDPTMFRELGSRYKNKPRGFKTMIITGVQRPEVFYNTLILANTRGDADVFGPLVQFLRRLVMVAQAKQFKYDVDKIASDPSMKNVLHLPVAKNVDLLKAAQVIGNVIDDRLDPTKEHTHFSDIARQLEEIGFLKDNVLNDIPILNAKGSTISKNDLRNLADKFSFKLKSDE